MCLLLTACAGPQRGAAERAPTAEVEGDSRQAQNEVAGPATPTVGKAQHSFDGFEILEPIESSDARDVALAAGAFTPEVPQSQRWRVIRGTDAGTTFERLVSPGDRFGASIEDRWGARRTFFLVTEQDGGLVMPATTSHEDGMTTLFEPALGLAPPLLVPGVPFIARSAMRVVEERDPARLRHRGRCERRLELEGRERIRTPLGEFDALRVRMEFSAKLQVATASDVVTFHIVPGLGVVAEERQERITAVGFVNRSRRNVLVREE